MKKVLITGANSYIGTSFEKYMKQFEGYQIDTMDMIDGTWRQNDFSGYDTVFHVAGIAHSETGKISEERKQIYYKVNTDLTIETAKKATALIHEIDSFQCMIPDRYHHGLIILLHTVAHLTHEGIGLRHLCDWASFVNTFENNDFEKMFKIKLKSFGLWKFAVILTKLCVEYLGMPNQDWINDSNCLNAETSNLLKRLIQDIMNSGNFGSKDFNRYREIKYIANEDKTVDSKRLLPQLFSSLNYKVYYNHKIIDRNRILLPIGWIIESFKYIILLATRKRKINNTKKMFIEASQRKVLYNEFDLFKTRYE